MAHSIGILSRFAGLLAAALLSLACLAGNEKITGVLVAGGVANPAW